MKFTLSKEKFLEGLQQVQNVVSTRTTLPILSNVLLQAEEGQLRLTTTDLDVGVRGSVDAQVDRSGSTTLPARRLFSIVRELPSGDISFDSDAKNVACIESGHSFFKVLGLPQEEFPPLPKFEGAKTYVLPQATLKDALKKTAYAISTDETRYVLNGVHCVFRDGKLTLVATDGRRLALVDIPLELTPEQEGNVIIPSKTVNELQRLLRDEGNVEIRLSQNQVAFELNRTFLVSKLIEGNYPDYRKVIPSETKERITIERETFYNAVRRVALLTSEKSSSVKLVFTKDNVDITANSPEIGEAKESFPIKYAGNDFTIAFNPEFLMAPLRNLNNDEIFLEFSEETSPGVIKINTPFLYVLMPMRISY